MALQTSGDEPRSNGLEGAIAMNTSPREFSTMTKVAGSVDALAASNSFSNVANKDKTVANKEKNAIAKDKKTTSARSQKQPKAAKKPEDKPKTDGTGWVSWLWTDNPAAPSVRNNGAGNWPKFK